MCQGAEHMASLFSLIGTGKGLDNNLVDPKRSVVITRKTNEIGITILYMMDQ